MKAAKAAKEFTAAAREYRAALVKMNSLRESRPSFRLKGKGEVVTLTDEGNLEFATEDATEDGMILSPIEAMQLANWILDLFGDER